MLLRPHLSVGGGGAGGNGTINTASE